MRGNLGKKKGATLTDSDFERIKDELEGRLYNPDNKDALELVTKEKIDKWDNKVDSEAGFGLSENNYSDADVEKVNTAYQNILNHKDDTDVHISATERAAWSKTSYERAKDAGFSGCESDFISVLSDAENLRKITLYNEVDITPMDESCFIFDAGTGTILGLNIADGESWQKLSATTELVIPSRIGGVSVEVIGGGDESIASVNVHSKIRLPNSIRKISENAFSGANALVSINIPTSCEKIGAGAFSRCINLSEIITPIKPNWELKIGERAFDGCAALGNIDSIIDGIKEIPKEAFYGCEGLRVVNIPESVDSVGEGAFGSCDNMVVITVSNPMCELKNGFTKNSVLLRGYTGASAWIYAKANQNPFFAIDSIYIDPSEVAM